MGASEIIKSYLISLGMEVDDTAMRKFNEVMHKANGVVEKHTSILTSTYGKAGLTVASAIGTIIGSTGVLLNSLAKADLGYQKYALTMMMSVENAKRYKIAMDALGESAENVTWMKEVNQQFRLLLADADKLKLPDDYGDRMKQIRSLEFEFTRLKHTASYFLQRIGYEIATNLSGEIGKAKKSFQEWNDDLIKNVSKWSKIIADKLMPVFTGVKNLIDGVTKVVDELGKAFQLTGDKTALMIAAVAAAFAMSGPFGQAVVVIGLVLTALSKLVDYMNNPENTSFEMAYAFEGLLQIFHEVTQTALLFYNILKSIAVLGAGIAADWFGDTEGGLTSALEDVGKIWENWDKSNEERKANREKRLAAAGGEKKQEEMRIPESMPEVSGKRSRYTNEEIFKVAQEASRKTGIPAELIYGQWSGETGGFTNRGARELNNLAGINVPGGKGQDYQKYGNLSEFADAWASLITRRYPKAVGAKTSEEFASGLKQGTIGPWYTSNQLDYAKMIQAHSMKIPPAGTLMSSNKETVRPVININIEDTLKGKIKINPSSTSLALAVRGDRY